MGFHDCVRFANQSLALQRLDLRAGVQDSEMKMSIKLRDVRTRIIREKDGSYAIACSALGMCTVGETLETAKKNFEEALGLHLSAVRESNRSRSALDSQSRRRWMARSIRVDVSCKSCRRAFRSLGFGWFVHKGLYKEPDVLAFLP